MSNSGGPANNTRWQNRQWQNQKPQQDRQREGQSSKNIGGANEEEMTAHFINERGQAINNLREKYIQWDNEQQNFQ